MNTDITITATDKGTTIEFEKVQFLFVLAALFAFIRRKRLVVTTDATFTV